MLNFSNTKSNIFWRGSKVPTSGLSPGREEDPPYTRPFKCPHYIDILATPVLAAVKTL